MEIKNALSKAAKIFIIIIAGLLAAIILFTAGIVITVDIINYNSYGKALMIDMPKRDADLYENTHGGFNGDGDTVKMYELSDKEEDKLLSVIKTNGVWKEIDDEAKWLLFGNKHSGGYYGGKISPVENGWYCVYDKQTKKNEFPTEVRFSKNYIIGVYSESEKKLWIYELDT